MHSKMRLFEVGCDVQPILRSFTNRNVDSLKISRLPAYKQVLKLGQERQGAILLDMGCCCMLTSKRLSHELKLDFSQLGMM